VEFLIKGNELLKPMESPLREIQQHFKSVSVVSSGYEDIYKNIIRPVQEEGCSGVKATVRWAVIRELFPPHYLGLLATSTKYPPSSMALNKWFKSFA